MGQRAPWLLWEGTLMQAEVPGRTPHRGLDRPGVPPRGTAGRLSSPSTGVPSGTWGNFARHQGGAKGSEWQMRRRAHSVRVSLVSTCLRWERDPQVWHLPLRGFCS